MDNLEQYPLCSCRHGHKSHPEKQRTSGTYKTSRKGKILHLQLENITERASCTECDCMQYRETYVLWPDGTVFSRD